MTDDRVRSPGAAFLLAQLGGHSSRLWTKRLAKAGLEPREVMLFRFVALSEGRSQREVAGAIGVPPSRVVALVDRLAERGWIERRTTPLDRRTRVLHLTRKGRQMLDRIMVDSAEHEADLTAGLKNADRRRLIELLSRLAATHGLIAGVHPGFADPEADHTRDDPT